MALRRTRPKTLTDRVQAGGAIATDAAKAAGTFGTEAARTVRDRALAIRPSPSSALEGGRRRALAVAGAAAGAAGGFAFWRSRKAESPPANLDPMTDPRPVAKPSPRPETATKPQPGVPDTTGVSSGLD